MAILDHPSRRRTHPHIETPLRVSLRERLSHFTWSWFECTMSTGALATLLGQQPLSFPGLKAIGTIFFLLNIVLFLCFSALIALRFSITGLKGVRRSLHHPHESFYFGTFWVSLAFILYGVNMYGAPACGPWLVKTLEVCFWIYAACALLVAIFQYHIIFDREDLPVTEAMPAWILPIYPFLVLGPLAGQLLYYQPKDAGTMILIGGITFQGLGWCFALIIYSIYITRCVNTGLPEESKRPGMYVAVGPAANALVQLGTQAPKILPPDYLGLTSVPTGEIWKAIGVPAGIFLWLVGFWFFALATVATSNGIRHMHFSLSWWAFIFPNAGLTIALVQIGNTLGSKGIQGVCSGATIILVIMWIFVAVMNVRAVWMGGVLWPGMDEDMEDVEGHGHNADDENQS